MSEAWACARVSNVEVSFWLWHRLKGPLLYTFPMRVVCWHVRVSTLHHGALLAYVGPAPHVPLWRKTSPVFVVSDHSAKHLQPARQNFSRHAELHRSTLTAFMPDSLHIASCYPCHIAARIERQQRRFT